MHGAPESLLAVRTTEAGLVVDEVSRAQPLRSVDSLIARDTHLRVRRL